MVTAKAVTTMQDGRQRARRALQRIFGVAAFAGLVWGIYLTYRWAEPNPNALQAIGMSAASSDVALRMDKTSYASYYGGAKSWALWAERIDLLRPPGSAGLAALQRAEITNIRDGKLYDPPNKKLGGGVRLATSQSTTTAPATSAEERASATPPSAVFSARQGHYTAGFQLAGPPELQLNYRIQWQFQLVGDVKYRTHEGDRLTAPSLTILQLLNVRTGHTERRIVCDEGVQVNVDKAQIQANSVRFDPATRLVECLHGVRGVMSGPHSRDTIQAERLYWSLNEQAIRCPESASGQLNGLPFTADGLNIDMKRHTSQGTHLRLKLPSGGDSPLALP
jgi:hypothetical protein